MMEDDFTLNSTSNSAVSAINNKRFYSEGQITAMVAYIFLYSYNICFVLSCVLSFTELNLSLGNVHSEALSTFLPMLGQICLQSQQSK